MKIYYGKSVHGAEEINAVLKTISKSTQMGKNTELMENKIGKLFYKKYSLMVNSGSSALLLAFKSVNFEKGSNVITPVLTFSTTVSSIIQSDLLPNFVDVKKETMCINEDLIESSINSNTRAICVPNLIGNIPDWIKIKKIAKKYNLLVIEDSADSLGAKINNNSTGKYSDISITSFYGSHIINCAGNGGMVCFKNKKFFLKAKLLRSWGRSSSLFKDSEKIENRFNIKIDGIEYDRKFIFEEIGYNLEPSEIGASFGLVQLRKLNKNIIKRQKFFKMHFDFFSKLNKYFNNPFIYKNVNTSFLAFPFTIKEESGIKRKDLQIFLEKRNIQTRVVFTGNILKQPGFKNIKHVSKYKNFKNADYIMKNSILIGCHHGMTKSQIKYIHNSIESFISYKYSSI
tara:strand:- start:9448 stop:10647 length:1200 start_codon:yes stop_codon:yes gene_type:complete